MKTDKSNLPCLSPDRIREAAEVIDSVFLDTPQFISDALSRRIGLRVLCKIECLNPVQSFKGRGAEYWCHREARSAVPLVTATTGNFGQALAYAARRRGWPVTVFAATTANPLKVEAIRQLGADVRLAGYDFDAAKAIAKSFAEAKGLRFVEDGREPPIAEGAGTIALELCRWPEPIDAVLVPVGNGALANGIGCWMKAHSPTCRVIGVCAAGAPAMAESWRSGRVRESPIVGTIADGIAVRVPIPEALAQMRSAVDELVLVTDEEILATMQRMHQDMGLDVEPAGAVGVAAALRMQKRLTGQLVAIPVCGYNLAAEQGLN